MAIKPLQATLTGKPSSASPRFGSIREEAAQDLKAEFEQFQREKLALEYFQINGRGYSGRMVLQAVEELTGRPSSSLMAKLIRKVTGRKLIKHYVTIGDLQRMFGHHNARQVAYALREMSKVGLVKEHSVIDFRWKITPEGSELLRKLGEGDINSI